MGIFVYTTEEIRLLLSEKNEDAILHGRKQTAEITRKEKETAANSSQDGN